MNNLIRAIIQALNPCIHQWDKIDLLHDDADDPSRTTIIRMCSVCGELSTVEIAGPPKRPKPHICPPHKWRTFESIRMVNDGKLPVGQQSLYGRKLLQECEGCGDTRSQIVGLSPRMRKKFGEDEGDDEAERPKIKGVSA